MQEKPRIKDLDLLRFIAATAVVFYHYISYYPSNVGKGALTINSIVTSISNYGFLGVELFFIISGFVILYSAKNKTWKDFIISRCLRIYPTLWLCATATFVLVSIFGATTNEPTILQYLANLTLFHRFVFNQAHLDGVYWTLTVEIRFYLIIAILMATKKLNNRNIILIMSVWSIIGLVMHMINKPSNFLSFGCYFAAGTAFFILSNEGMNKKNGLYLLFTTLICLTTVIMERAYLPVSKSVLIIIMMSIFVIFHLLISGYTTPISKEILAILGGITYPLYLLHQEIGYSLLQYIGNPDYYLTSCFILYTAFSLISYYICTKFEPYAKSKIVLFIKNR